MGFKLSKSVKKQHVQQKSISALFSETEISNWLRGVNDDLRHLVIFSHDQIDLIRFCAK